MVSWGTGAWPMVVRVGDEDRGLWGSGRCTGSKADGTEAARRDRSTEYRLALSTEDPARGDERLPDNFQVVLDVLPLVVIYSMSGVLLFTCCSQHSQNVQLLHLTTLLLVSFLSTLIPTKTDFSPQ